ncbi:uncharacterized protein LOC123267280 [Cotesia glomerata]|uniref:uncharacterized protein LOC123267280 n=1 Tax=Cotesia glomerata TaxID=32391 RepID=UPI001D01CFE2|nr:uncharacterized protein LOC123267280 [Cotesia glomerata]
MSKSKRKREREEREDKIWKKLKELEEAFRQTKANDQRPPSLASKASGKHRSSNSGSSGNHSDTEPSLSTDGSQQENDLPSEDSQMTHSKQTPPSSESAHVLKSADSPKQSGVSKTPDESELSKLPKTPEITDSNVPGNKKLEDEIMEILGEDHQAEDPQVGTLHPEIATRWSNYINEGLKKELKSELLSKYPRASNCQLEAQVLNPEISATMQDAALKRDKYASEIQKTIGSAMLVLGMGISLLLDEKDEGVDRKQLLQYLSDAGKLIAEAHHREAVTRRSFILPGMEKNIKEVLEKSKMDKFLFGEGLSEKIKSTKTIEKVAAEMKPKPTTKKLPLKNSDQLNWKTPSSKIQWSRMGSSKSTYKTKPTGSSASRKPYQQPPQPQSRSTRPKTDRRY